MKKIELPRLILRCNTCGELVKIHLDTLPYNIEKYLKKLNWQSYENVFYCPEHKKERKKDENKN